MNTILMIMSMELSLSDMVAKVFIYPIHYFSLYKNKSMISYPKGRGHDLVVSKCTQNLENNITTYIIVAKKYSNQ